MEVPTPHIRGKERERNSITLTPNQVGMKKNLFQKIIDLHISQPEATRLEG